MTTKKDIFVEMKFSELEELNGGGVGGFIVGYTIGAAAGYVATAAMAACGGTQNECQKVLLSCIATGAAIGSMCPA